MKYIHNLLQRLKIEADYWNGTFSSNFKMVHYLKLLKQKEIQDTNKYIFHTDVDEFADRKELVEALKELDSGTCDAIKATWTERVAIDGSLRDIDIFSKQSLLEQFPLNCKISRNFMPERTTVKVLMHRSHYRLVSGQHNIWCEENNPQLRSNRPWDQREACLKHIKKRADQTTDEKYIYSLIPSAKVIIFDN